MPHRQLVRNIFTNKALYEDYKTVLYVDAVNGNNSNSGLSPNLAKLTIDNARATIVSLYNSTGKIYVNAPITTPASGFIDFGSVNIEIDGYNGQMWYIERTTTYTTGWTDNGGGIYQRSNGTADADIFYVTTQLDSDGFFRILTKNTSTPTTPNAGEFGRDANNFYVHLVDDENPNSHTTKRPNTTYTIRTTGSTNLTIRNCYSRYAGSLSHFDVTSSTSTLKLINCIGVGSGGSGVSIPVSGGRLTAFNCRFQRSLNDGYNINANRADIINCDGSYNYDEGASPHNSSVLNILGGRYHHNNHGGCTAINSSVMNLNGVIVENNGLDAQAGIEANGINYANTASGQIINTISRNNDRSGFYCANSGVVTFNNFSSGIENGNLEVDVLC